MTTIKTKFQLRYDTYANWTTNNPTLLKGEIAVVALPLDAGETIEQAKKPAVLFKVGDGTTDFNTLPWASAKAADVYDWAKAARKPKYTHDEVGAAAESHTHTKSEITDFPTKLSDFENDVGYITSADKDTNTTYQIVANGKNSFKLQSKELDGVWADVPGSVFTVDFESVNAAISAADQKAQGAQDAVDAVEERMTTAEGDIDAVEGRMTIAEGEIDALQSTVSGLGNALHFVGAGKDASKPAEGQNGDVYIATDTHKEYVWSNGAWEEFGSGDHLTKAEAEGLYLKKESASSTYETKEEANAAHQSLTSSIGANTSAISDLKDGTIAAGNASKLNGQDASYYATESDLTAAEGRIGTVEGYFSGGKANSAAVADSANAVAWTNVSGKPSTFTPEAHTHKVADITDLTTEIFVLDGGDSLGY